MSEKTQKTMRYQNEYDWRIDALESFERYINSLPEYLTKIKIEMLWETGNVGVFNSNLEFTSFVCRE